MFPNDTNSTDLDLTIIFELDDDSNVTHRNNQIPDTSHFYGYPIVIPLALSMIVFMILAIMGNVMVVLTIIRHKGMRTRTNIFIVNLAVADILVAALDMPVSLATILEGDWIFGDAMCKLNGFTMALFLICSIHTLMYIAIHKYISISRPFSRAMTPRRIKMMIAASWIWATICAFGPVLGWNRIIFKKGASQCGPDIPRDFVAVSHSLFITTSNYIIPLSVMSFCYYRIFKEIHVHMNRIRETSNIDLQSSVDQQKKVSVTLFLVLACFLVCWTPFVIYSTAVSFMKNKQQMPYIINPLAYWCGYLNSACNPVIYAFRSPSFRQGYKEIVCGRSAVIHSGVHSLSFRSKSNRGSLKSSNSNVKSGSLKHQDDVAKKAARPKRMLSQTSWISLPMLPYLVRSVSSVKGTEGQRKNSNTDSIDFQSYCCLQCQHKRKRHDSRELERQNSIPRRESFAILDENGRHECETVQELSEPSEIAQLDKKNVRFIKGDDISFVLGEESNDARNSNENCASDELTRPSSKSNSYLENFPGEVHNTRQAEEYL